MGTPAVQLLRAGGLIGAAPLLLLTALLVAGELRLGPALLAIGLTATASLGLGHLWVSTIGRLSRAIAAAGEGAAPRFDDAESIMPGLDEVAGPLARLAARRARPRADAAAIVEHFPDPLIVLDADRAALRANAAARGLFGGTAANPGGGDLSSLLRHPLLASAVDRALADGAPQSTELHLPLAVPRDVVARAIPMDPPLADGGRLVLVLADRTELRAVERMRADFVANVSHELRSPLGSLSGFIETLRGPAADDDEARERFLGIMATQAARMQGLIDDLLSLSRIEASEHQPPEGEADLAALLRAELAALEPMAGDVRLEVSAPERLPAAPVDARQMAQVMRNLLDNAIRHGRRGGVVRVSLGPVQGGLRLPARAGVLLGVADDGPGIPREHIPRLTERFYRVDPGRARATGGTGLGLAIVKHIVNRHRGLLLIDSEPGRGAQFRVWLPVAAERAGGSPA